MSQVLRSLLATSDSLLPTILRIGLALVILPHGFQKTLGTFGGLGFAGTMQFFTGTMRIPAILALAAILTESVGALLVLVGLGTRAAAAAILVVMVVAVLTTHLQHGFFMNWWGTQSGEGFEFHLLVIILALGLVVAGGGRWSVDGAL